MGKSVKKNHFLMEADEYDRDIDIMAGYIEQQAIFLYKSVTNKDLKECVDFVIDEIFTTNPINDPIFTVLDQNDEGDRVAASYPFSKLLKDIVDNKLIVSPTFTQFYPPDQKKSLVSLYIEGKLKERSDEKKLQFKAQREGNDFQEVIHNNNQNNAKILVNAISGNHRSVFSILYDQSTHPVLTSNCRIANGSANSNDERFLEGNRHYYNPDVVIANITSIITLSPLKLIEEVIEEFNLHVPTVSELMFMIKRSADNYWRTKSGYPPILRLLNGLTPAERCAVLYTGDLYHLSEYNNEIVREILMSLTQRPTEIPEDYEDWIMEADEDTQTQVRCMYPEVMGDKTLKDSGPREHVDWPLLGATAKQIYDCFEKYQKVIKAFWLTKNVPFLISDFPSSIRKATVGSDTDSAIFTAQRYVQKYTKTTVDDFSHDNVLLAEAVGYLVSMTTRHNLAVLTTNEGVMDPYEKFRLAMKNELLFPVFWLTSRSKHYWGNKGVQEGQILTPLRREKKGVELIANLIPDDCRADLDRMLDHMTDEVLMGKKIKLTQLLRLLARWEYTIYDSVSKGETQFLKTARVNEEEGYSDTVKNPKYVNYLMWNACFADKYGQIDPPPYSALSFSIIHDTKKKTQDWLNSWDDQERAKRFGNWLNGRDMEKMGEFLLPESVVLTTGIPEEILDAIDVRKIVYKAMSPFYLALESLEFYMQDKHQTRLVMDMIDREEAFKDIELV